MREVRDSRAQVFTIALITLAFYIGAISSIASTTVGRGMWLLSLVLLLVLCCSGCSSSNMNGAVVCGRRGCRSLQACLALSGGGGVGDMNDGEDDEEEDGDGDGHGDDSDDIRNINDDDDDEDEDDDTGGGADEDEDEEEEQKYSPRGRSSRAVRLTAPPKHSYFEKSLESASEAVAMAMKMTRNTVKGAVDLVSYKHVGVRDIIGKWRMSQEVQLRKSGGAIFNCPATFSLLANGSIVTSFNDEVCLCFFFFPHSIDLGPTSIEAARLCLV